MLKRMYRLFTQLMPEIEVIPYNESCMYRCICFNRYYRINVACYELTTPCVYILNVFLHEDIFPIVIPFFTQWCNCIIVIILLTPMVYFLEMKCTGTFMCWGYAVHICPLRGQFCVACIIAIISNAH